MDLREFVKTSIVQIAEGIEEANVALKDSSAMVNPINIAANSESAKVYGRTRAPSKTTPGSRVVDMVEFDVSVVAEVGEQGSAGAKLSIASIGVGADGKKEKSNKSESRIKFSVPIVLPGYNNQS
ncbi:MAG: hypothetical protein HWE07_00355 [Cytophagia bacterium]|nr:hypothetical protein [Cytophagia bacterium]